MAFTSVSGLETQPEGRTKSVAEIIATERYKLASRQSYSSDHTVTTGCCR